MPTDLDPIAVLRRTDPAADLPVPPRPAVDELVFYGTAPGDGATGATAPSAETVSAAQEQLDLLVVPSSPGG
jgi:hypothetical protein